MGKNKKILIIKSCIFVVIVVIVAVVINEIYIQFVFNNSIIKRRDKEYLEYTKNHEGIINYLILGSSHSASGINPQYIPGSINFSEGSQNFIKSYYKLRKVLYNDKVKVNNIILEIDLQSFSSMYSDRIKTLDNLFYYSKFITPQEIKKITGRSSLDIWIKSNFPFLGNGKFFFLNTHTSLSLGWQKSCDNFVNNTENRESSGYVAASGHFKNKALVDDASFDYFVQLLKLATDNEINVIFIINPATKHYDLGVRRLAVDREGFYSDFFKKVNFMVSG